MLQIRYPFHGAVLTHRNGKQTEKGLAIEVRGIAPLGTAVKVNGIEAKRCGERFSAIVTLTKFETEITAEAEGFQGTARHSVKVVWDKYSYKRYRFSIDDNSFWYRDLLKEKPARINDNMYLAQLKKLHDEFGVKFTLNLFYETPEKECNLSMMPTDWKSQFIDNAEWMRLTWHAYNEFPDRPYQYATPEKVAYDYDKIHEEVVRFAGEQSWAPPTIVHWGELLPSALPTLYQRGVRALSGYFKKNELRYDVSYGLDEARCAYLESHDALMDFGSGITFSRIDIVFNSTKIEDVIPTLEPNIDDEDNGDYLDLLTHEQYFWPFYKNYIPDHAQRIATGLRFLTEHGYKPIWQHEGFLGTRKAED